MAKKKEKATKPKVHPELQGFDVEVNSFGEVRVNYDMDKLNQFLNRNVADKKFKDREDLGDVPKYKGKGDKEGEDKPEGTKE